MAKQTPRTEQDEFDQIPFRLHPRVFASLGADLVTNDTVAVIELVKNSYDAFAENVWIRFRTDAERKHYLEIQDDGMGMTRKVIEEVWCLVATPFKADHPMVTSGKKSRRVAGEKGLGRLSVSRLGDQLKLVTQAEHSSCLELNVDWSELASGDDIGDCFVHCRRYPEKSPFETSGTRLRIYGLRGQWDASQIDDLEENLARLVSPFSETGDFNIHLSRPGSGDNEEVRIEAPKFLAHPKYVISGTVDSKGSVEADYAFSAISSSKTRKRKLKLTWEQIFDLIQDPATFRFEQKRSHCGPFKFEIRAWDIGSDDTQEIAEKFDFQKSQIRKAIRAHKGISVYRDGILVLPKSDNARDWLGLDLRRVSKVGTRMSTSQLVGYVSISADKNPGIMDTSDRERLVSSREVAEFEEILKAIIGLLEIERDGDRQKKEKQEPLKDLFGNLSAEQLVAEVKSLADDGAEATEAVPLVQAFSESLDSVRKEIQERFVYYSRMATIGTIAQMLVHEIRNRTTSFGGFLEFFKIRFGPFKNEDIEQQYRFAVNSVTALERLADTFAPLASRAFRRRKRSAVLEERIRDCVEIARGDLERKRIKCDVPNTNTTVAMDPGELEAVILNLLTNAIYWLGQAVEDRRMLQFRLKPIDDGKRLRIWVHDSGPGVADEDSDRVFLPGVTRKPGGIGMGLTIASEIVADYGGQMTIKQPGTLGGASFAFDVPLPD